MTCGIYKITCNETGKCYIGQSQNIEKRWKSHRKRFPPSHFTYEILMPCDVEWLSFFEKACISGYSQCGELFNITKGGNAWGWKNPEETKRKMSEVWVSRKERKEKNAPTRRQRGPMSEEQKIKISLAMKGRKPKPASEETRKKMSEAKKGNTYKLGKTKEKNK
jgi:group I intron endonuclease